MLSLGLTAIGSGISVLHFDCLERSCALSMANYDDGGDNEPPGILCLLGEEFSHRARAREAVSCSEVSGIIQSRGPVVRAYVGRPQGLPQATLPEAERDEASTSASSGHPGCNC